MGTTNDQITADVAAWIARQRMFFVATAPLAADGMVNCSPKGLDTFRILGPRAVAYLDLTGSGIETAAHVRENARIVLMFCAFDGPPMILRIHGCGRVLTPGDTGFAEARAAFPDVPGVRGVIHVDVTRVADSCGFAVPRYEFASDRDQLTKWTLAKGETGLSEYRAKKNAVSLDGLPGLTPQGGDTSH